MIFLSFIITLFFANPNTAKEILKMFSFVCNASSIFLNIYHQPLIGKIFRFLPYFPYWSLIFDDSYDDDHNLKEYLLSVSHEPGMAFSPNTFRSHYSISSWTPYSVGSSNIWGRNLNASNRREAFLNYSLLALLIQMLVYPLIFYYLKNVIRNEKDTKRRWFYFMDRFKKKSNRIIDDSLLNSERQYDNIKQK